MGILDKRFLHYVFLAVLVVLVYSGTLGFPFQFDDVRNIIDNPIIKNFSFFIDPSRAVGFERYEALRSRYLGYLSFFFNYRLNGLHVIGYHVVNILIHVLNSLLVYKLVVLSFQTPVLQELRLSERRYWIALLAATLFAVHPVNTQAVTYIVQRLASLAALFYLCSMTCYIKARLSEVKTSAWGFYLLSLLCCIAAMKTKENAFTLPLVIALYEMMFFLREKVRERIILLFPFALTMLIVPFTLLDLGSPLALVMGDAAEKTLVQPIPRIEYLFTEMRVIATYLRLLVLPMNQTLDYDYPRHTSITETPVILSLMFIVALLAWAVYLCSKKRPSARLASFGMAFFFLALSMESTFVPLHPIYEHRLYLPGIGLLMAFSVGAGLLYGTLKENMSRSLFIICCATTVIALAIQTVERNTVWRSDILLWSDVVKKAPGNARGYMALGVAFDRRGEFEKAEHNYKSAVELRPNFPEAFVNLGASYGQQGNLNDALKALKHALRLDPKNADAYNNLGNVFFVRKESNTAIEYYEKSLLHDAGAVSPRVNLIKLFLKDGEVKRAREELSRLRKIDPKQAEALLTLFNTK